MFKTEQVSCVIAGFINVVNFILIFMCGWGGGGCMHKFVSLVYHRKFLLKEDGKKDSIKYRRRTKDGVNKLNQFEGCNVIRNGRRCLSYPTSD